MGVCRCYQTAAPAGGNTSTTPTGKEPTGPLLTKTVYRGIFKDSNNGDVTETGELILKMTFKNVTNIIIILLLSLLLSGSCLGLILWAVSQAGPGYLS